MNIRLSFKNTCKYTCWHGTFVPNDGKKTCLRQRHSWLSNGYMPGMNIGNLPESCYYNNVPILLNPMNDLIGKNHFTRLKFLSIHHQGIQESARGMVTMGIHHLVYAFF